MDPFRHVKNSHPRHEFSTKLTVTGRLDGTQFGRPVGLEASGREVLLRIDNLRSAWRLRRSVTSTVKSLLRVLSRSGIALRVRIGSRLTVEVLPKPSSALRVLVPALNIASSGGKP